MCASLSQLRFCVDWIDCIEWPVERMHLGVGSVVGVSLLEFCT